MSKLLSVQLYKKDEPLDRDLDLAELVVDFSDYTKADLGIAASELNVERSSGNGIVKAIIEWSFPFFKKFEIVEGDIFELKWDNRKTTILIVAIVPTMDEFDVIALSPMVDVISTDASSGYTLIGLKKKGNIKW